MGKTKPIRTIEMVREIRDEMSRELAGKSDAEVIAFFNRAGDAARKGAKQTTAVGTPFQDLKKT